MVATPQRRARASVGLLAVILLVLVAGCQNTTSPGAASPTSASTSRASAPSATATASLDPKAAAAIRESIAAYQGFFAAYAAAAREANPDYPDLAKYSNGPILLRSRANLDQLRAHGAVELGHPTTTVLSSRADLGASIPAVILEACNDYTDFQLVYRTNKSPVPNDGITLRRYTSTVTAYQFTGGRWLTATVVQHRETPC